MDLYKAPYKAMDLVKKFQELGLDDELVKPSNVVSTGNLERKFKKAMEDDSEASSHESNLDYLKQLTEHIQKLMYRSSYYGN